jgi:toxin CcdB
MQFDVHRLKRGSVATLAIDLQDGSLARLPTRIMAPLVPVKRYDEQPFSGLNPVVEVRGVDHVILFQDLASVPVQALGEVVESLAARRYELVGALDLLFTGI